MVKCIVLTVKAPMAKMIPPAAVQSASFPALSIDGQASREFGDAIWMAKTPQKRMAAVKSLQRRAHPDAPLGGHMSKATAMILCCMKGDVDAMACLFGAGAGLEARSSSGQTPLMAAAACGKFQAIEWLLERGADALAVDHDGDGLIARGHLMSLDKLAALIDAGADPAAKNARGRSAVEIVADAIFYIDEQPEGREDEAAQAASRSKAEDKSTSLRVLGERAQIRAGMAAPLEVGSDTGLVAKSKRRL